MHILINQTFLYENGSCLDRSGDETLFTDEEPSVEVIKSDEFKGYSHYNSQSFVFSVY